MRKKKEIPVEGKPVESPGAAQEPAAPKIAQQSPEKAGSQKPDGIPHHKLRADHAKATKPAPSDKSKTYAVVALAVLVVLLAFYFLVFAGAAFVPGNEVSNDSFKDLLISAQKVYIVMDVRGAQDAATRGNILQCGVDFSASTFLGSKKEVIPFSIGDNECFGPEGSKPINTCISQLKDGLTIDVRQGPGGVKYYSNGMVVLVGSNYTVGGCGLKLK
jgi:hypothetical protein